MAAVPGLVMHDDFATWVATVLTDKSSRPGGHYEQATVCNGLVYVSGQLPVHPDGTYAPESSDVLGKV